MQNYLIRSIYRYFLENNINMNYNKWLAFFLIIGLMYLILKSILVIIIYIEIKDSDINIKLNIKYLFGLINIKKQIYPKEKEQYRPNEKTKGEGKPSKLLAKDILNIYRLIRMIKIYDFYSNIEFGNKNIYFTSFIYVFINTIYGYLANYINPDKLYLIVKPNYLEDYLRGNIKIHIKAKIINLAFIGIKLYRIVRKRKIINGGNSHEGDRVNPKFNGNNA